MSEQVTESPAVQVGHGTLVAVHAHPDDETLATGGLLAQWAAAGGRVVVITATRGERGETIGDDLAPLEGNGPVLAAHRERELRSALGALGVQQHHFLDDLVSVASQSGVSYEDSGMAWTEGSSGTARALETAPARALVRASLVDQARGLAQVLGNERPSVVATYDPVGGYGHPDHVRVHDLTMLAVSQLPGIEAGRARPEVWWRVSPPGVTRAADRALDKYVHHSGLLLAPSPGHRQQLSLGGPAFGSEVFGDEALAYAGMNANTTHLHSVSTGSSVAQVLAAMRAHRSQIQAVQALDPPIALCDAAASPEVAACTTGSVFLVGCYALSNGVIAPILDHEFYLRRSVAQSCQMGTVAWPS